MCLFFPFFLCQPYPKASTTDTTTQMPLQRHEDLMPQEKIISLDKETTARSSCGVNSWEQWKRWVFLLSFLSLFSLTNSPQSSELKKSMEAKIMEESIFLARRNIKRSPLENIPESWKRGPLSCVYKQITQFLGSPSS